MKESIKNQTSIVLIALIFFSILFITNANFPKFIGDTYGLINNNQKPVTKENSNIAYITENSKKNNKLLNLDCINDSFNLIVNGTTSLEEKKRSKRCINRVKQNKFLQSLPQLLQNSKNIAESGLNTVKNKLNYKEEKQNSTLMQHKVKNNQENQVGSKIFQIQKRQHIDNSSFLSKNKMIHKTDIFQFSTTEIIKLQAEYESSLYINTEQNKILKNENKNYEKIPEFTAVPLKTFAYVPESFSSESFNELDKIDNSKIKYDFLRLQNSESNTNLENLVETSQNINEKLNDWEILLVDSTSESSQVLTTESDNVQRTIKYANVEILSEEITKTDVPTQIESFIEFDNIDNSEVKYNFLRLNNSNIQNFESNSNLKSLVEPTQNINNMQNITNNWNVLLNDDFINESSQVSTTESENIQETAKYDKINILLEEIAETPAQDGSTKEFSINVSSTDSTINSQSKFLLQANTDYIQINATSDFEKINTNLKYQILQEYDELQPNIFSTTDNIMFQNNYTEPNKMLYTATLVGTETNNKNIEENTNWDYLVINSQEYQTEKIFLNTAVDKIQSTEFTQVSNPIITTNYFYKLNDTSQNASNEDTRDDVTVSYENKYIHSTVSYNNTIRKPEIKLKYEQNIMNGQLIDTSEILLPITFSTNDPKLHKYKKIQDNINISSKPTISHFTFLNDKLNEILLKPIQEFSTQETNLLENKNFWNNFDIYFQNKILDMKQKLFLTTDKPKLHEGINHFQNKNLSNSFSSNSQLSKYNYFNQFSNQKLCNDNDTMLFTKKYHEYETNNKNFANNKQEFNQNQNEPTNFMIKSLIIQKPIPKEYIRHGYLKINKPSNCTYQQNYNIANTKNNTIQNYISNPLEKSKIKEHYNTNFNILKKSKNMLCSNTSINVLNSDSEELLLLHELIKLNDTINSNTFFEIKPANNISNNYNNSVQSNNIINNNIDNNTIAVKSLLMNYYLSIIANEKNFNIDPLKFQNSTQTYLIPNISMSDLQFQLLPMKNKSVWNKNTNSQDNFFKSQSINIPTINKSSNEINSMAKNNNLMRSNDNNSFLIGNRKLNKLNITLPMNPNDNWKILTNDNKINVPLSFVKVNQFVSKSNNQLQNRNKINSNLYLERINQKHKLNNLYAVPNNDAYILRYPSNLTSMSQFKYLLKPKSSSDFNRDSIFKPEIILQHSENNTRKNISTLSKIITNILLTEKKKNSNNDNRNIKIASILLMPEIVSPLDTRDINFTKSSIIKINTTESLSKNNRTFQSLIDFITDQKNTSEDILSHKYQTLAHLIKSYINSNLLNNTISENKMNCNGTKQKSLNDFVLTEDTKEIIQNKNKITSIQGILNNLALINQEVDPSSNLTINYYVQSDLINQNKLKLNKSHDLIVNKVMSLNLIDKDVFDLINGFKKMQIDLNQEDFANKVSNNKESVHKNKIYEQPNQSIQLSRSKKTSFMPQLSGTQKEFKNSNILLSPNYYMWNPTYGYNVWPSISQNKAMMHQLPTRPLIDDNKLFYGPNFMSGMSNQPLNAQDDLNKRQIVNQFYFVPSKILDNLLEPYNQPHSSYKSNGWDDYKPKSNSVIGEIGDIIQQILPIREIISAAVENNRIKNNIDPCCD